MSVFNYSGEVQKLVDPNGWRRYDVRAVPLCQGVKAPPAPDHRCERLLRFLYCSVLYRARGQDLEYFQILIISLVSHRRREGSRASVQLCSRPVVREREKPRQSRSTCHFRATPARAFNRARHLPGRAYAVVLRCAAACVRGEGPHDEDELGSVFLAK